VAIRIRVSDLSLQPVAVFLSDDKDIAYLKLAQEDLDRLGLRQRVVISVPSVETEVKMWGFPGTISPQPDETKSGGEALTVVAVYPDYFVLNDSTESGYSGGPVLDRATDDLLGMAIRSEEKQTRVLLLQSHPADVPFTDYTDALWLR
jgi:hypothetical protein